MLTKAVVRVKIYVEYFSTKTKEDEGMKKILALLLALATVILTLVACVQENGGEQESSTVGESSQETQQLDNLPADLKFNGEDVVVLSRGMQKYTVDEVAVPELNSEPVNDAMFNRNIAITDRLNVKIVSKPIQDTDPFKTVEEVERVVKAGGQDYDLFAGACYVTLPSALRGTFCNLGELEYLDLSQSYWMQGYNETVSYGESQYTATGMIALSTYRLAIVTMFNKVLFDDRSIPYPYEAVENNEWTLDHQATMIEDFYQDLNGNGARDEEDLYGHVSGADINVDAYWSACNVPLVQKDADGAYEWVLDTAKLSDAVDKLMVLFHESGGTYICKATENTTVQPIIREMFAESRAATVTLRLLAVELDEIRNMEDEYGIVPMPKFDAAQTDYYTQMHDQFTVFAIPVSVASDKLELIGATMEAMASESLRTVKPAYYEIALKRKYMSDPIAWDMLDLAFDHVVVDAGVIYADSLEYPHHKLRDMILNKENTVSSQYGKAGSKMNKALTKIVDEMERLG